MLRGWQCVGADSGRARGGGPPSGPTGTHGVMAHLSTTEHKLHAGHVDSFLFALSFAQDDERVCVQSVVS